MLSLQIKKQDSVLNKLETLEIIEGSLLEKVINSDKLQTEKYSFGEESVEYENEKEFLLKFKKVIRNNKVKVTYKLGTSGYARVYANKCISLGCIRRAVRHTLAKDYYVDIDMENCHPNILYQLCKANGLKCDHLEAYCKNRSVYIQNIMDDYQVDRDSAKTLFIILLYCGSFETWANNNNLINVQPSDLIKAYAEEMKGICQNLYNQNKVVETAIIKERTKKGKTLTNPIGTVSSYICQEYERRMLEQVYTYLKDVKEFEMKDCVLCYDGLMIKKELFEEPLLNELSNYVFEKTGFRMKFTQKIMDEDFTNELEMNFNIDETKLDRLDLEYFKTIKSYQHKKIYFENFVCKVMKPQTLFLFTGSDKSMEKDVCMYSENGIRECFKQLKSGRFNEKGNETRFIDEWLEDDTIKVHDSIDFIPYSEKSPFENKSNVYNTFKGYNPLISSEYTKEKREEILKPFNDLGTQICEGSPQYWSYLKKFFAHMIQKPNKRLPILFIIHGPEGTGKNVLLDVIGNLIGSQYYKSSANIEDFFGTHAEGFINKLLVNINETEAMQTSNYEGRIKSIVTEPKLTVNQKGIRPFDVQVFARLFITTNRNNPLRIDVTARDRRNVVFKTTEHYLHKKYTSNFWSKLVEYFRSPGFISALYDELIEMDIEKYNFGSNRPITDSYKAMRKLYVPIESLFLEDWIETYSRTVDSMNSSVDQLGSDMYEMYCDYCKQYGQQTQVKSLKRFYAELENLKFPIKTVKPQNKTVLRFNPKECYDYMLKRGFREENENDLISMFEEEEVVEECDDYDFNIV